MQLVAVTGAWALIPGVCASDEDTVIRLFDDPPIPVPQWVVWRGDETSESIHQFVVACRGSGGAQASDDGRSPLPRFATSASQVTFRAELQ